MSPSTPPPSSRPAGGIGQPVRRPEDARLLTGQGCLSDDVELPGQAYAVIVRVPHAHARIRSIDGTAACALPLGLRGGGEGGITPALGVDPIEMPARPERVRRAIRDTGAARDVAGSRPPMPR